MVCPMSGERGGRVAVLAGSPKRIWSCVLGPWVLRVWEGALLGLVALEEGNPFQPAGWGTPCTSGPLREGAGRGCVRGQELPQHTSSWLDCRSTPAARPRIVPPMLWCREL